jgi:DNA-binding response OmpR family regulator
MTIAKILIVEDDSLFQSMLKAMLEGFQLTIVGSGEAGVEAASEKPDIIFLDINLPGIDGYETCSHIRALQETRETPIVFLSAYTDLEDRLKAYGVGGTDYISKPVDKAELLAKIELHRNNLDKTKQLKQSHGLLMEVQNSSAKIQAISRFIQSTLFCTDINMLLDHFFRTAKEIGADCVLRININEGVEIRSSDGEINNLEQEIIDMSDSVGRIHPFGNDRAIFNWGSATLLLRKVVDLIDIAAMFMDALEGGIKAVKGEGKLLSQIELLGVENSQAQIQIGILFKQMDRKLRDTILSLGLVAALDMEEEDRLTEVIDLYQQKILKQLDTLNSNNKAMSQVINERRTPPPELKALMEFPDVTSEESIFF